MDQASSVARLIEPSLNAMGYDLVRVRISGSQNMTLQVMAERADGDEMTVEDCADISRNISAVLDVEDPITDAYTLEVSSPGLDRPLVRLEDYVRFSGFEARIDTRSAIVDRKRFLGILGGVDGDAVHIVVDGEEYTIPFDEISRAKLVLTDELIAASQKAHREKQKKENV
jgi:ribosome maturation factor RimP